MPLIWNASGVLQLVQSLESILIVILMGYFLFAFSQGESQDITIFNIYANSFGLSIYACVIFLTRELELGTDLHFYFHI